METIQCERVVIGAGVVGLAVAATMGNKNLILLESHSSFGNETSSRNSEVIHSGIHYPADSLKTQLCLKGRDLLRGQSTFNIESRLTPCGKIVVAGDVGELEGLERLAQHAERVGVPFEWWDASRVRSEEPRVVAQGALFFPESAVIDSHGLMASLESTALGKGAMIAYRHRVVSVAARHGGWLLEVEEPDGRLQIQTSLVINASGLGAARLSNLALGTNRYEHRFCRGRYFGLAKARGDFQHLVYPLPQQGGLGVHVTFDQAGLVRLGPDMDWCADSDPSNLRKYYDCDWESLRPAFAAAAGRYLKGLKEADLSPGLVGIRPKLFLNGEPYSDFLIENIRGWIHCLGIESPGLTSCLAIAEKVVALIH